MCGEDLPNDNQPHSGSFFLGGHKRLKCIDVQRDAFSGIGDFQYDDVVGHKRIDGNPAALRHRFAGVFDQIEQRLLHLIAIDANDRQIGEPAKSVSQCHFGQDAALVDRQCRR